MSDNYNEGPRRKPGGTMCWWACKGFVLFSLRYWGGKKLRKDILNRSAVKYGHTENGKPIYVACLPSEKENVSLTLQSAGFNIKFRPPKLSWGTVQRAFYRMWETEASEKTIQTALTKDLTKKMGDYNYKTDPKNVKKLIDETLNMIDSDVEKKTFILKMHGWINGYMTRDANEYDRY